MRSIIVGKHQAVDATMADGEQHGGEHDKKISEISSEAKIGSSSSVPMVNSSASSSAAVSSSSSTGPKKSSTTGQHYIKATDQIVSKVHEIFMFNVKSGFPTSIAVTSNGKTRYASVDILQTTVNGRIGILIGLTFRNFKKVKVSLKKFVHMVRTYNKGQASSSSIVGKKRKAEAMVIPYQVMSTLLNQGQQRLFTKASDAVKRRVHMAFLKKYKGKKRKFPERQYVPAEKSYVRAFIDICESGHIRVQTRSQITFHTFDAFCGIVDDVLRNMSPSKKRRTGPSPSVAAAASVPAVLAAPVVPAVLAAPAVPAAVTDPWSDNPSSGDLKFAESNGCGINDVIEVLFDGGKPQLEKLFKGTVTSYNPDTRLFHVVYEDGDVRDYTIGRMLQLKREATIWKDTQERLTLDASQEGLELGQAYTLLAYANTPDECVLPGCVIVSIGEMLNVQLSKQQWEQFTVQDMKSAIQDATVFEENCREVSKMATDAGFVPGSGKELLLLHNSCIRAATVHAVKRQVYLNFVGSNEFRGFTVQDLQKRVADAASSSSSFLLDGFGGVEVDKKTLPDEVRSAFETIESSCKAVLSFDSDGYRKMALDAQKKILESRGINASEQWLYHGANPTATQLIVTEGYQNTGVTKNGKLYGRVYILQKTSLCA